MRQALTIYSDGDRKKVQNMVWAVPKGSRIEVKGPSRTHPQNDRMHAMVRDVASQALLGGRRYDVDEWKAIFMRSLGAEIRMLPDLDGGFFPWTKSTRDLSKQEMSDLIELIAAWGAQNGVVFHDPWVEQFNGEA